MRSRDVLYTKNILVSFGEKCGSVCPVLGERPLKDIFDDVVGARSHIAARLRALRPRRFNEAECRRVEALVLLLPGRNIEGCVLCGHRVCTGSSQSIEVLLAHQVHFSLVFLEGCGRLHGHFAREHFEVLILAIFVKLVLCSRHILDLVGLNELILVGILTRARVLNNSLRWPNRDFSSHLRGAPGCYLSLRLSVPKVWLVVARAERLREELKLGVVRFLLVFVKSHSIFCTRVVLRFRGRLRSPVLAWQKIPLGVHSGAVSGRFLATSSIVNRDLGGHRLRHGLTSLAKPIFVPVDEWAWTEPIFLHVGDGGGAIYDLAVSSLVDRLETRV